MLLDNGLGTGDQLSSLRKFKPDFSVECKATSSPGGGGGGGGGVLYRYVRPQRVWFFSRFGHKLGNDFSHFGHK